MNMENRCVCVLMSQMNSIKMMKPILEEAMMKGHWVFLETFTMGPEIM